MASAETLYRPIGRFWMGAFLGFFLGPAIIVGTLILSDPERVTYSSGGFLLIFSVAVGTVCGAAIGSACELRARRRRSTARIVAELAGALTGGLLGVFALTSSPWIGSLLGAIFGAISGGLLTVGTPVVEPDAFVLEEDAPLWDREIDS